MASRLDRILDGPPPTAVDVPWTEVQRGAPSGSRESQRRETSPHRSHADTPSEPVPGQNVSRPQPLPASKAGHRVKSLTAGPLTRGRATASSKGGMDHRSASPGIGQVGDVEPRPAPARELLLRLFLFLRLKQTLEQAQPSMAKRLKVGAASKDSSSSDPRPSTCIEGALPRPSVGESAPLSPKRRKKEKKEREQETRRQPHEEQQLQQKEGEEGQPPAGPQLEELLEQDRQRELQELQEQQQQRAQ
ncbi:histone-lysine N-methyltransferase 2D-like [Sorghum bicolor]|uniref:histone-lysine N-methyltransferase 2D-like n=1 Tax=Sorghum bicolor TaxID=4558 RepID=UPI000B425AE6|nr:histone-lysine N-methyltransferase 2D-like [Sorghum bicolor]|eukprot:XP_021303799.1 histone-lysine N-methyltransferase 2D-like [Sorghum bicolor]